MRIPLCNLAIDPGQDFGYAFFDPREGISWHIGSYSPHEKDWISRVKASCAKLRGEIKMHLMQTRCYVGKAYIEMPGLFKSDGGQVTADSGALVQLAFATGALAQVCMDEGAEVKLIEVNTWKGQMSKGLTNKRIREVLDETQPDIRPTNHAWDAVGIGLFVLGRFS